MVITSMKPAHVPAVAALEKQCFSDPWSAASLASELENPRSLWLVALDGDRLAGYVGSQAVLGEADMMNLAVDSAYRRQGVGRDLVRALIAALGERQVTSLTLEVRDSNFGAISLYESLGFQQVGLRRNYYFHPREDGRILKKEWEN